MEEASDDSNSNSDRKLCYMKSFSRTPSPAALSAASSQISLDQSRVEPIYRSRLNTTLSNSSQVQMNTNKTDQVQYASLMVELEQALIKKDKIVNVISPELSNSDHKSSDADFSKELEAALQLIHDLESPNTPSDNKKPLTLWRNSSDSEKTLDGSLAELTSPDNLPDLRRSSLNGKLPTIIVSHSDSQSTSGYSSPTRKRSSIDDTNFTIKNTNSSAVISLFVPNKVNTLPNKSVTLIKLNDDMNNNKRETHVENNNILVRRTSSSGSTWNPRSLLRKKKSIHKLSPELESAIIKSESLAHLTDLELLERCERNREMQRVR